MPPKFRDVQKRLEEEGWRLKDQKGSHRQFVHPTRPGKVTLAGKSSADVPPSIYNFIQKQAGWKP